MKPMLAKGYKPRLVSYPCYVQPKLNGVRALWLYNHLQSRSYGRDEEVVWCPDVLPHIHKALEPFSEYAFDGELYVHGWSLQKVNSCARVTSTTAHRDALLLEYHIFDLIADMPFFDRWEILNGLELNTPLFKVETVYCTSEAFGDQCYRYWKSKRYEGAIYRDMQAHYGFLHNSSNQENRWKCLLKRKQRLDMEVECVGVEESDKFKAVKVPHIKSLQLRTDDGITFSAGGGLTHEERIRFLEEPPIGCVVRISYDSLSEGKVPLQPSIDVVYV